MASEQYIEIKLLRRYRVVGFFVLFLSNFWLKRFKTQLDHLAERILKAGMRYKSGKKWKKVF